MIKKNYSLFLFLTFLHYFKVNNSKIDTSLKLYISNNSLMKPILSKHINMSDFMYSILKEEKLSNFSTEELLINSSILQNKILKFQNKIWDSTETKREIIEIKSLIEQELNGDNYLNISNDLSNKTILNLVKTYVDNNSNIENFSNISTFSLYYDNINNNTYTVKYLNDTNILDDSNVKNLNDLSFLYRYFNKTLRKSYFNLNNKQNLSIYTTHINKNISLQNLTGNNYLTTNDYDLNANKNEIINNTIEKNHNYFVNSSYNKQKIIFFSLEKNWNNISTELLSSTVKDSYFQNNSNISSHVENNYLNESISYFNNKSFRNQEINQSSEIFINKTNTNELQGSPKIINEENFSIQNNTLFDPFSLILSIDNKAKEILIISTSFATMLLCISFLILIFWLCCATSLKDSKPKISTKQLLKSIKETESNSRDNGILKNKVNNLSNDEYILLKKIPPGEKLKENKSTNIDQDDFIKTQRSNNICRNILKSKFVNGSIKEKTDIIPEVNKNIYFQSFDSFLQSKIPLSNKNQVIDNFNKKKQLNPQVNQSFVEEYDNPYDDFNEEPASTKNRFYHNSKINDSSSLCYFKPRKDIVSAKKSSKYLHYLNNRTKLITDQSLGSTSRKYSATVKPVKVTLLNNKLDDKIYHSRSKKKSNGKVVKNFNNLKLTREQIEKEFFAFTLEIRRRLDQLFLDSSSSIDSSESFSSSPELIMGLVTDEKKNIHFDYNYKNNFPMFKSSTNKPPLSVFNPIDNTQFGREKIWNDDLSSVRTKRQIWHI